MSNDKPEYPERAEADFTLPKPKPVDPAKDALALVEWDRRKRPTGLNY